MHFSSPLIRTKCSTTTTVTICGEALHYVILSLLLTLVAALFQRPYWICSQSNDYEEYYLLGCHGV
jgi:hypothetical protein